MHKGIYITKLVVRGSNKPTATIELDKGMNILSGASNTGKSYISNCIDFIFGAQNSPKDIPEANGYAEVLAEIKTFDGKTITISRSFNDNQLYVAECSFSEFDKQNTTKLSSKHSPKTENNISSYLLNLIGLKGKKLKTNDRNETREISFRDLARFCLITEDKIISDESPVHSGQFTLKTVEDSLFRLILSGKDDDDLETFEDPKMFKSKVKGKIEFITSEIEGKETNKIAITKELEKHQLDELNIQINQLTGVIDQVNKDVLDQEEKRQEIWKLINDLNSRIIQIRELKYRFKLLNDHYDSDLNRLEFINEGMGLITQLEDINCPLCGNLVKQGALETYEQDAEKVSESIKEEYQKIRKKKQELLKTVENIESEETELIIQITNHKKSFEDIDKFINSKLKPIYEVNKEKLEQLFSIKRQETQIDTLSNQIIELKKQKQYYEQKLVEKEVRAKDI